MRRDNFGEFLAWGFLDRDTPPESAAEKAELAGYIDMFEKIHGRPLPPGYDPNVISLRLTFEPVRMSHRSLLWYWCMHVVDLLTSARLWANGFALVPTSAWFAVFPGRPQAALFARLYVRVHGHCLRWIHQR